MNEWEESSLIRLITCGTSKCSGSKHFRKTSYFSINVMVRDHFKPPTGQGSRPPSRLCHIALSHNGGLHEFLCRNLNYVNFDFWK